MSFLCGCLRNESPTSLDAPFDRGANLLLGKVNKKRPNERQLAFAISDDRGINFDFIPDDDGNYIAKFRSTRRGDVIGRDSKPIPKAVFENFHIISKKRRERAYCVLLDTGGVDLLPYFRTLTDEDFEELGFEPPASRI